MRENSRLSVASLNAAVLLLLSSLLIFCYHLGKNEFRSDPPARINVYAGMLSQQNEWLAPELHGKLRLDEPPVYLWLVKFFSNFSSEPASLDSRMPAALAAVAIVMLAGWWFQNHAQRYGRDDGADAPPEGFALLAGMILATSPLLVLLARSGLPDTTFALVYLGAAYCWGESLEARRSFYSGRSWSFWVLCGYALTGLAMLTKGPAAILLLVVPYALAARSYRISRPSRVHAIGLLMALGLSIWWPLIAGFYAPDGMLSAWKAWLAWGVIPASGGTPALWRFPVSLALDTFPWIIPALVMVWRVGAKLDRSPTLVFWMCSLVANFFLLWPAQGTLEGRLLLLTPFIALLAAEGFYRWNFENKWAVAWRVALRVILVVALALGLFIAILLNGRFGEALFIIIPLGWLAWTIRSRMIGVQYTPWESTIRLATIAMLIFLAGEATMLSDWIPRERYHSDVLAYFERIDDRLAKKQTSQTFYYDKYPSPLYDYHLKPSPTQTADLNAIKVHGGPTTFMFASDNFDQLLQDPALVPLTALYKRDEQWPREMMFRVNPTTLTINLNNTRPTTSTLPLPADAATSAALAKAPNGAARAALAARAGGDAPSTATASGKLSSAVLDALWRRMPPVSIGVLGNSGTRKSDQTDVGNRLNRFVDDDNIQHVLLLGNNLVGPSEIDHLDFIRGFERPYERLLKRGVSFHALLGHEDQSHAYLQLYYPPFHMYGQRYYSFSLGYGMVEVFMLDSDRPSLVAAGTGLDAKQMDWLSSALEKSKARWKIIALHRSPYSAASNGKREKSIAAQLAPLIQRSGVAAVLSAWGAWYERLGLQDGPTAYVNAGWSGESKAADFERDDRLMSSDDQHAGFVVLTLGPDAGHLTARTEAGAVVDETALTLPPPTTRTK